MMIAFENDIFPRQIAAQPGSAQPPAAKPKAVPPGVAKGGMKTLARQAGGAPIAKFQNVFEAEARSLAQRPGASIAGSVQPATAGDGGFQRVFENDVLPPLPARQAQTAGASAKDEVPLWDNGGFGFSDILDVINPLQHLPIISTIYRAETGDQIGAIPRILGSMLYGGSLIGAAVGAVTAVVNLAVEQETGKDIGAHIYTALFGEGGKNAKSTTVAAAAAAALAPAPQAAAKATAAAATSPNPLAISRPAPAKPAIAPASATPRPAPAPIAPASANPAPAANSNPPRGGVRVTGKDAPPTSLSAAAAQAVTSQFRRSVWYRKNQDTLTAQAAELLRARAAAKALAVKSSGAATATSAGGPQAKTTTGRPDMLRLFTGKAASGQSSAGGVKSKSATGAPPPVPKAVMAREMSKAMAKYEQLLKSRVAAGAKTDQLK